MSERDYTKFIRPDGKMYVRRIPRAVYVEMVRAYQHRPDVVEEVFEMLYWRWDLDQSEQKAASEGRDADRVTLAHEMMADMEDGWKVTAAFEEHLVASFASDPAQWAEFLDPVYDLQEAEGWRDLQ